MANSKATKKALFMSMLSLLLCFTMLMGATFAWFTDTVQSTGNRIQAGNLKVDLVMDKGDGNGYVSIAKKEGENAGDIFSIANDGNGINWEPGKTEIVYLGVRNNGSLALKYNIVLDIRDYGLADSLEYAIVDGVTSATKYTSWENVKAATTQVGPFPKEKVVAAQNGTLDKITTADNPLTIADADREIEYFALAVHMKEEATNEFQDKYVEIDVEVLATQLAAEFDSFDNTYDENADFDGQISGIDSLKAALAEGGDYQVISDLSLTEPMKVENTLELSLGDNTVTGGIEVTSGADLTISGGNVVSDNSNTSAIQNNGGNLTVNDVEITSARHGVRVEGGNVTINSGTYKVKMGDQKLTQHALNVSDGGNVTINGGTFVGPRGTGADSGAAVNVQAGSTVTINGGDFSGGLNNTLASNGTLIIKGGTFDQDPSAYVAPTYESADNGDGTYTVVRSKTVDFAEDMSEELVVGENDEMTLNLSDKALNNTLTNNGDVTVNGGEINATANNALYNEGTAELNNVTLNMTDSTGYITNSRTEGSVTIYENVTATSSGGGVNVWEGKAIFKSGTITTNSTSTSARHMFYVANGAELTIEGGEFIFNPTNLTRKGSYICAQANATVIVNGGTFHKPSTRTAPVQALEGSTVTIYGGTFAFDPSAFVADGYAAIESNGWWTVSAK